MSFGWNQGYPNCTPVTVTLQPPPFTMNIPGASLCCPDQLFCVDPCRPCSPTVCPPMICSPTVCAPSPCAPAPCAPAPCAPVHCAPVHCGPAHCAPAHCAPAHCAPAHCAPAPCAPNPCAPMVCSSGLSRSRYSSCFSSCSLPSRKYLPRVQSICDPCTKY